MSYVSPKTDWSEADTFKTSDMNRAEVNIEYLAGNGGEQQLGKTDDVDFGSVTSAGAISGTTGIFSGNVSGVNANFTGQVLGASINTGHGAFEIQGDVGQNLRTTDAVTFLTVNTGQGANELYPMNQAVRTTDSPTFSGQTLTGAFVPSASPVGSTISVAAGATVDIPRGIYNIAIDAPTAGSGSIVIYNSSGTPIVFMKRTFPESVGDQAGGAIISDGSTIKAQNGTGATVILRLYKF